MKQLDQVNVKRADGSVVAGVVMEIQGETVQVETAAGLEQVALADCTPIATVASQATPSPAPKPVKKPAKKSRR